MNEMCNEISEILSGYIDGVLSPEEETALRAHLDICRDCRDRLELMKEIHSIAPDLSETAPSDLVPNVMQAVRAGEKKNKRFSLSNFRFTAIAAVIVVLVLAVGKLPIFEPVTENVEADIPQEASADTAISDASQPAPASVSPAVNSENSKQNVNPRSVSTDSFENSRQEKVENTDDSEIPYSRDFSFYVLIASDSVPASLQELPQETHRGNIFIVFPASDREAVLSKLENEETPYRVVEGDSAQDSALIMISPTKE